VIVRKGEDSVRFTLHNDAFIPRSRYVHTEQGLDQHQTPELTGHLVQVLHERTIRPMDQSRDADQA